LINRIKFVPRWLFFIFIHPQNTLQNNLGVNFTGKVDGEIKEKYSFNFQLKIIINKLTFEKRLLLKWIQSFADSN